MAPCGFSLSSPAQLHARLLTTHRHRAVAAVARAVLLPAARAAGLEFDPTMSLKDAMEQLSFFSNASEYLEELSGCSYDVFFFNRSRFGSSSGFSMLASGSRVLLFPPPLLLIASRATCPYAP